MITPGSVQLPILEIMLDFAHIRGEKLRLGAVYHYVHGLPIAEAAHLAGVDKRNLRRVRKSLVEIDDKLDQINRIKCGLVLC